MHLKSFLYPLFCGTLAMMVACSSDDPTPTNGPNPPDPNSSSGANSGGSGEGGGNTPWVSPVALATVANKDVPAKMYEQWRSYHFVTRETEAGYYPELVKNFGTVFGDYNPVGRVIWSAQTGYYKDDCAVESSTKPEMLRRGCTVSEGIGYGMLLSSFQGDTETFNSLWNFSRALRKYTGSAFTPWITYGFTHEILDRTSATDADLDIATSLILMHYKTGNEEYLNDAKAIINGIWEEEIEQPSLLLLSGDDNMWKKDPTYNLSYFSPVALRLFARVDGAHDWNGVVTNMYAYMRKVQDGGTGVFPDWSDAAGAAKKPPNGSANSTYYFFDKESVRIPWRIAWDYYWFQDENAKAILDKLNAFIVDPSRTGGDPDSKMLNAKYSWNTSVGQDQAPQGSKIAAQWLAAWCLTGITGNADWLNKCTAKVNERLPDNSGSSYFKDILMVMYAQLLNGVYERPFSE